jgi:hypothetical protein
VKVPAAAPEISDAVNHPRSSNAQQVAYQRGNRILVLLVSAMRIFILLIKNCILDQNNSLNQILVYFSTPKLVMIIGNITCYSRQRLHVHLARNLFAAATSWWAESRSHKAIQLESQKLQCMISYFVHNIKLFILHLHIL